MRSKNSKYSKIANGISDHLQNLKFPLSASDLSVPGAGLCPGRQSHADDDESPRRAHVSHHANTLPVEITMDETDNTVLREPAFTC